MRFQSISIPEEDGERALSGSKYRNEFCDYLNEESDERTYECLEFPIRWSTDPWNFSRERSGDGYRVISRNIHYLEYLKKELFSECLRKIIEEW